MGLPSLSSGDQNKVKVGNALMKFSASLFKVCHQLNTPVAIENPHSSRIWSTQHFVHLANLKHVQSSYTDFCMDKTPWRKRTRIMFTNCDLKPCFKQCCSRNGKCDRTGLQHVYLCGKRGNVFWTLIAEPYPHNLCKRMATKFLWAILDRKAAAVMKHLTPE